MQLDYLPASTTEWFVTNESPTWEANIFTLDKDMRIGEVATRIRMSTEVPISGFTCKFDLYKLREDATKPDDGELLSTATRTFKNQGYHRTALDAPVYLKAGDRLGIVVQQSHTFDDGITKYGIDAQETVPEDTVRLTNFAPLYGTPVVNEGESFWKCEGISDQEEVAVDGWIDLTAPISEKIFRSVLRTDLDTLTEDLANFYVSRAVGTPYNDYFCIDNFCIKAFGEPCTLEHVDADDPTAEKAGCIEHWRDPETGATYADELGENPVDDVSVYLVTVKNGTADQTKAMKGERITITADEKNGSSFRYWKVTDGSINLEDSKAAEISFIMPGENVTVSAVFTGNSSGSGTVSARYNVSSPGKLSNGSFESSAKKAKKGEQVTVTVTPDEGYQTTAVNITDKNGNMIDVTDNGDGTYTFTMPDSEVTITPAFTEKQKPDESGDPDDPGDQACPKDDTCPITPYTDTDKNEWYHDGVHWALEKGIMNGTGDHTFEPLTATSRAMIVTMLWRMEGSPQADGNVTFKDVPDGQWYTDAVCWASANDIVNGYDESTFGTNDSVTREQLATILYRSTQSKDQGFTGTWAFPLNFDDADQVSEWADEAMHWMTMNGIIQGISETTLSPKGEAVRAQVATILMRMDGNKSSLTYDEFKALTAEQQIETFNNMTGEEIYSLVENSDENWPVTAYDLITPENAKETIVLYDNNGDLHFNLAWPPYGGFLPESIASIGELSGKIDVSRDGGDGGYTLSYGRNEDGSYPNNSQRSVPKSSVTVRTGILDVDQYRKVVDVVTNGENNESRLLMLRDMGYDEDISERFLQDQTAWLTRDEISGADNIDDGARAAGHTVDSRYGYYGTSAPWVAEDLNLEGGAGQLASVFSWGTLCDSGLVSDLGTAEIH